MDKKKREGGFCPYPPMFRTFDRHYIHQENWTKCTNNIAMVCKFSSSRVAKQKIFPNTIGKDHYCFGKIIVFCGTFPI